jgi:hypothetical protein
VSVETYIVRIYRRYAKRSARIEGVVEEAGANLVTPFHSIPELLKLLHCHRADGKEGARLKKRRLRAR